MKTINICKIKPNKTEAWFSWLVLNGTFSNTKKLYRTMQKLKVKDI